MVAINFAVILVEITSHKCENWYPPMWKLIVTFVEVGIKSLVEFDSQFSANYLPHYVTNDVIKCSKNSINSWVIIHLMIKQNREAIESRESYLQNTS